MNRFEKEMRKRFRLAFADRDGDGETGAYTIPEKALIVFYSPQLTIVLEYQRNGKQRDVTNDYPRLSAPYLVYLCGGDENKAREILESNRF